MANNTYTKAKLAVWTQTFDLNNSNYAVMLTYGYVPDVENDGYISDISAFEVSGTGYYRQDLSGIQAYVDPTNHRVSMSAQNVTWTAANFKADGAVIYNDTGVDATNQLVCFIDFLGVKQSQGTNFIINWSVAEGIIQLK